MPENPASYRVVRTKSYLFNKADYGLNLFGMYGRKVKLSHSEMIEDNKKDLAVNDHGLTCPSTTDCSDRCSDYINPEHKKTIKALQDAGYLK
ncbi:type IV secretion protein Rhs [Escherichia coli]|nr:type IV secretion protein Rhs [Escherichia coli]